MIPLDRPVWSLVLRLSGRLTPTVRRFFFIVIIFTGAVWLGTLGDPAGGSPPAPPTDRMGVPDVRMPVYKPRKENLPRARIGGYRRGSGTEAPLLIALVPDHVAFTIQSNPALCWYLSTPTSRPITVTLVDSRGIRPILEEALPSPLSAGIHCVRLKQYGVDLKEQEQYRWFVTLVWDPDKPSQDVVAGGMIERIPFDEACALSLPCTRTFCEQEAVYRYAESGLWYDAIACLLELLDQNRDTDLLQRMLDHLLYQSGVSLPNDQVSLSK